MEPTRRPSGASDSSNVELLAGACRDREDISPRKQGLQDERHIPMRILTESSAFVPDRPKPTFTVRALATWSLHTISVWPGCCALSCLGIVALVIGIGLLALPVQLDMNFGSFLLTDTVSALLQDAADRARESLVDASTNYSGNANQLDVGKLALELNLAYELQVSTMSLGVLDPLVAISIRDFEQEIQSLSGWKDLCNMSDAADQTLCNYGVSYVRYMFATINSLADDLITPLGITLDGLGREPIPYVAALQAVYKHGLEKVFFPAHVINYTQIISSTGINQVMTVRSIFRFVVPNHMDVEKRWTKFCAKELLPKLRAGVGDGQLLRVYFNGTSIAELEVEHIFSGDAMQLIGAGVVVLAYALFHTRSLLLSVVGIVICVSAVPFVYVLTAIAFGHTSVPFGNVLAVFVVLGFGFDIILIYADAWRDSAYHADTDVERLEWAWRRAARTTFASTAMTSLSFFANVTSAVRALRLLGFFVGLSLMFAWIIVAIAYMPLCLFNDRLYARCCEGRFARLGLSRVVPVVVRGSRKVTRTRSEYRARAFAVWVRVLNRFRRSSLAIASVALVVLMVFDCLQFRVTFTNASLYPETHNLYKCPVVFSRFAQVGITQPPDAESVCQTGSLGCRVRWCPALKRSDGNVNTTCQCFTKSCTESVCPLASIRQLSIVNPMNRDTNISQQSVKSQKGSSLELTHFPNGAPPAAYSFVLETWDSGSLSSPMISQFKSDTATLIRNNSLCCYDELCFCGPSSCIMDRLIWRGSEPFKLVEQAPHPLEISASQVPNNLVMTVPVEDRSTLTLYAGIFVDTKIDWVGIDADPPSWRFSNSFSMSSPWSQRDLLRLCMNAEAQRMNLHIDTITCWSLAFKDFVTLRGDLYPVAAGQFDILADAFHQVNPDMKSFCWFRNQRILAVYMPIRIDVNKQGTSYSFLYDYRQKWTNFQSVWERGIAEGGNVYNVFFVCELFVDMDITKAMIASTASTFALLFSLTSLGLILFTKSFGLCIVVTLCILFLFILLGFFIIFALQWKIGVVEVVAVVYFLGYSITYPLQMGQLYAARDAADPCYLVGWTENEAFGTTAKERFFRTSFAMQATGGAIMGGAISTVGASMFMCFCTLTLFTRLGGVCITISIISFIVSLWPLPAALLTFAPLRPGHWQWFYDMRERRKAQAEALGSGTQAGVARE